ncbi:thioredoxin-like-domain-containing protein [Dunaliella salina]|uniref:Thioredoxin-like-domain-containing protein n=1 Tax=Dunaliella salina TaxID=3046 RepID=A0ABQ7GGU0_DUNSA|nr:thioredoxin-like-domain-containing protein [Dunaliella salina]|eukprot:KAF5833820.1 thioredoxin-like-domain-containing protein [Dunaliella salina]
MGKQEVDLRQCCPSLVKKTPDLQMVPVDTSKALADKYVGIYFSAHWCPPCRAFTPALRKFYMYMMAKGRPFEIIFVSSDKDQQDFEEYFLKNMPWLTLPWEGSLETRHSLARMFAVAGIPYLVIVGPDGKVLNSNARTALIKDPLGERFPWDNEPWFSMPSSSFLLPLLLALIIWFVVHFSETS